MELEDLKTAIVRLFPELSDVEFKLKDAGWDCVAVDVDDRLIFKFPRHAAAEENLAREARLLSVVRPSVTMTVPDLSLHRGPPTFSRHDKIAGDHLVTAQYEALPVEARQRLAADMGLFYAQLHAIEGRSMEEAGAGPIRAWLSPDDILRRAWQALPDELRPFAKRTVSAWAQLPPDPYGTTYGFFDGHGWNMAFDHEHGRLNGVYDFGDSGFGSLHQDFIYSSMIARELTARIIAEYETLTGRLLDRDRIELLTGVMRLSELAEYAQDARHATGMIKNVAEWAAR